MERWRDGGEVKERGSKVGRKDRRVERRIKESRGAQVQGFDLPGSVGISEPSFATHLQPLTRCH